MPKVITDLESTLNSSVSSRRDKKKAKRQLDKTKASQFREEVYPEYQGSFKTGDDAMTYDEAIQLMGWEVQSKEDGETLTYDVDGKPVRCVNNLNNRPFNSSWVETLAQEILRKRWKINGETIIIGRYGSVLSGQHRLASLIRAVELWRKDPDKYPDWESEPTMDTMISVGIIEDDDVVNTIDTGHSRSLSDVFYRSDLLQDIAKSDRKAIAKACEHSVRLFWDRTGVEGAYDIARTHSESMAIFRNHPKLFDCVRHVYEENVSGKLSRFISVGYGGALCYLMAASNTKGEDYYGKDVRSEENLDLSELEAAQEFWVELAKDKSRLGVVRDVLAEMHDQGGDAGVSLRERIALLVKAWNCGSKVTRASLLLKYHTDEDGFKHLEESPILGGIDKGEDKDDEVILADEDEEGEDPTEEEIEEHKQEIKKKKQNKKLPKEGDEVWVDDGKGKEPWFGTIQSIRKGPGGKSVAKVRFQQNQKTYDVPYDNLSFDKPDADE